MIYTATGSESETREPPRFTFLLANKGTRSYAGMALMRRVAFTFDAETMELVLDEGEGAEFSFSDGSFADGSDGNRWSFSLLDVDVRSFEGSRIDAELLRCWIGALIVLGVPRTKEPEGMRVGVAALADWLRLTVGGGPIAPSTRRLDVLALRVLAGPLARMLLARAGFVSVEGV